MNTIAKLLIWTIVFLNWSSPVQLSAAEQVTHYPSKPVRIIVPFPPGSADTVARIVAQRLSASLGQPFVIENRSGAGGVTGTDFVAKSPPNGYTLLFQTCSYAGNPCIYEKLPYDTIRDFEPIALACYVPLVLVSNPSLPVNSLPELIALAKAQPNKLHYANNGSGTISHVSFELFNTMANVRITGVQYKGAGPSVIALMSGEVQLMIAAVGSTSSYLKSGRLKAIAMASDRPSPLLGNLPTMSDTGVPGFDVACWQGILAPKGTPQRILNLLNDEIVSIMKMPESRKQLSEIGFDPASSTRKEFEDYIKKEIDMYCRATRDAGIARLPLK